jgi:uncharacterized lipoprotein YmbA
MKLLPLRTTVPALLAVLLTACAGQTLPVERYYRLSSTTSAVESAAPAAVTPMPVIAVEPVEVHGIYVESALLHRSARPLAPLEQYPYASWAEPPDILIGEILVADLRHAFGAMRVLAPGQRSAADIHLAVNVRSLEQIRDGDRTRASYAATYVATRSDGRVLFVMDWAREAPATGPSPLEFVTVLNGLIGQADGALIERLKSTADTTVAPAASP